MCWSLGWCSQHHLETSPACIAVTSQVHTPEHYSPSSSLPYKLCHLSESLIPSVPIPEVFTHESPPSEVPILKASLSEDVMPETPKPAARRKKKSPSFRKHSVIKKVHSIVIDPADKRISVLEKVPILDETSSINDYHKTTTISADVHPTPAPRKGTTGLADPPKKSNGTTIEASAMECKALNVLPKTFQYRSSKLKPVAGLFKRGRLPLESSKRLQPAYQFTIN
uniref:Uncharacterized protein n=1 Tax=Timema cristinae TaxID=61476 RepID=A0A7R9DCG4_TIMCR|nr:unnamed protein product [Timema cristinae]